MWLSLLSEIGKEEAQLVEEHPISKDDKVFIIKEEPVMECALDVLMELGNSGKVTMAAKGNAIPTAVAVANIITENMMKGNSKIVEISVDSESGSGKYGMTLISTIKIMLAKTN